MLASVLAEFLVCCQNAYFANAGLVQGRELGTGPHEASTVRFRRVRDPHDAVTLASMTAELQQLTFVESLWFEEIVAGGSAARGGRSMQVDPSVSLRTRARSTGPPVPPATRSSRRRRRGRTGDLSREDARPQWVLLAVIEETARHAGHAGIIREQINGRTGR